MPWVWIGIFFLGLSFGLFFRANRQRTDLGMPNGRIIYDDASEWEHPNQSFYDQRYGLIGRPDYLIKRKDAVIPVEVKSGQIQNSPHPGDILQLAAYCLLMESFYGKRPTSGVLRYANKTFQIDFTLSLEDQLKSVLEDMRRAEHSKTVDRSHEILAKCTGCGYRSQCKQRLF